MTEMQETKIEGILQVILGRLDSIDKRFEENDIKLNGVLDAIADVHDELRASISLNTHLLTNHERRITSLERFTNRSV